MNDFTAASAVIEELAAARAASATETVTEGTTCRTCSGRGMIGGPSYYAPDEGGEPCPDCAAPQPAMAAEAVAYCVPNKKTGKPEWGKNWMFSPIEQGQATMALYAAPQPAHADARPTDDELWDQTLRERDEYHGTADKLAAAIAKHFGVDIGEHSNANCPWEEALEVIENAVQAGAPVGLSDEQITEVWNSMPGGNDGFLKSWGYIEFGRRIEDLLQGANHAE
ncbi:hypothetical protein [Burkholderia cepacia]|nr:hypothetical protein [Burkholderia cepacia]ALK22109.1 hypothetical protein APZ15_30915 [Burkholderia cepacia ATCC 25416]MCA8464312.1 hypothetical protein [Burkholderia cepacia]MDN7761134.1 hypothetical protein [Burkholderia cepacia]QCY06859.1 hypothetical protein EJ998_28145 [Burkholderia cepacia ATCC 25416]